ncbi:MAG: amidohydrolase [Phycisphaerales bacterium]
MHHTTTITMIAALTLTGAAFAQDLAPKAPAQDRPIAIVGATVHTVTGAVIEDGVVSFADGELVAIGPRGEGAGAVPRGAEIIDLTGQGLHVYPGLIGANTMMGLLEIGAVRATLDYDETGQISPEVRASIAVNPDSTIIPVTRSNGILTVGVLPSGGAIPGRASVIRMDGWTYEDLTIDDDAGVIVNWPSIQLQRGWWVQSSDEEQRTRTRERIELIDEAFDEAEAYLAARAADESTPVDLRWEALRGVIAGADRLLIRANELDQIMSAVTWARDRAYKVTIVGGMDAPKCAEFLVRHDAWVLVTGTHRLPDRRDDPYDWSYTVPVMLEEAGVTWCLGATGGSFETPHERNLPYHAATAVAHGLDHDEALRSITIDAAKILGVDDTLGSLEVGKAATLIVTDGTPLEMTTEIAMAFIDGRMIDLSNKQTVLAEKYREKYRQLGLLEDGADTNE